MARSPDKAENTSAKLTRGSIAGHLVRQTTPAILGVAAIMSVGLIDAYFVGRLGQQELAAISFVFPIITALSSLGVGVMVGVNSVVSRALGEGDEARAVARANLGMILGLVAGLAVGVLLFVLRAPLFALMQADAATLPLIDEYMRPYALGFPLLLAMMGMNGVLRAQGAAKSSTAILVAFSSANWVLDPILIDGGFGFAGFGIAGAAYATVIGWVIALVAAFVLLRFNEIPFAPSTVLGCNPREGLRSLTRVGGPAAFSNAINPTGLAILTAFLAAESQAAVAGFGAGGRLQTFAVVPLLALSGSIGAIVGQNWGAGEYVRARRALIQAGAFCLCYGLAAAVTLYSLRGWFARLFSDDAMVVQSTVSYLAISVWGYAAYGVVIVVNGALNAVDRAGTALALSLSRVLLVMVPVAWLLRPAMGTQAVYSAELAANGAGFLAAVAIAWHVFGRASDSESASPRAALS